MTEVAERLARKGDHGEPPRRMQLSLSHIGVWSSTKLGFMLSMGLNLLTVAVIWLVVQFLEGTEVFADLTGAYQDLTTKSLDLSQVLEPSTVLAFMGAVVLLNTVLLTGLSAAYALLFNMAVRVTNGSIVAFRSP